MREFFSTIYGDLEGHVCISRINPLDPNATPRDKFFEYPAQLDDIVKFCTRWSHTDVYTTPILTDGNGRRKPNMTVGRVAYGDADEFNPANLEVEPSIVVHTSEEKSHVYWVIEDVTDPTELERMSHAVSLAHPKDTTGYDTGWASNKLLRVPGTSNNKYDGVPYEVHYEVTGKTYTQEQFAQGYKLPEAIEVVGLPLEDIPTREEALGAINYSVKLEEILVGSYYSNHGYSRYKVLHLAQQELFRCGATNEQAFAILQNHDLNKWRADGISNPDERLWDDIIRARVQSELSPSEIIGSLDEDLLPEKEESKYDFLTAEERASLKPTFVDMFADWSASKTTTARCFQEAAAFGVLSTVFGELGYVPMKFGKEHLNMWFIIAGRSTIDRKSTVMRHMTNVLDALSDEDYQYDLGGDFTTAGIAKATLDKANRSGIIVRDEFQSLLEEFDKNYMSGAKGQLTMMFDGHIPGRLRASDDHTRKAKVAFALSFYGLGISSQITEQLTEEDFFSGFLTRFLWVTPPNDFIPAPLTEGFEVLYGDDAREDKKFLEIVQMVRSARTYHEQFADGLDAPAQPVGITPEVHERMKKFLDDIAKIAKRLGKEQIASSGQRLVHNAYKAAALLAMVECKETIEMHHVLSAIHYGSEWFSNMIAMSNNISSTRWEKQLMEIIAVLEKRDNELQYGSLYREFKSKYKPKDFKDMLEALQDSGYIKLRSEAGRSFVSIATR